MVPTLSWRKHPVAEVVEKHTHSHTTSHTHSHTQLGSDTGRSGENRVFQCEFVRLSAFSIAMLPVWQLRHTHSHTKETRIKTKLGLYLC